MARFRLLHAVVVLMLVASLLLPTPTAFSQVTNGATMTVLRGQVALIHADGSAVQPAPSGTFVVEGDEIRTLKPGTALITFFSGIEIELGEDTIITINEIESEGTRVNVGVSQVFGTTVSRIQGLTDPASSYRIDTGGAIALVRGSTIAMRGPETTPVDTYAAAVCIDCGPGDYIADLGGDDDAEVDESAVAWHEPTNRTSLARLPTLPPDVDTSAVFTDEFWQAYGFGQPLDDDSTANALTKGEVKKLGTFDRGDKVQQGGRGYVWTVAKSYKKGDRYILLRRTVNGKTVTKRLKISAFLKAGGFREIKVNRTEDPVNAAAEGIGDISSQDQDGKSPGIDPAGNNTKKSKKEDDTSSPKGDPVPDDSGAAHHVVTTTTTTTHTTAPPSSGGGGSGPIITDRATTTALNCTGGPSPLTYFCQAIVTTDDGLAPRPTGTVTFGSSSAFGLFLPSPTCALTPFPPPVNRSSCAVNYIVTAGPTTVTADYVPDPGFLPSGDAQTLP